MEALSIVLQITVGLGLLNVWLIRHSKQTAYRGAGSTTIKEEFKVYGLPSWAWLVVGGLKVIIAILLLTGIFYPSLRLIPAAVLCVLMLGAVSCHIKVKDTLKKTMPASAMLGMSLLILLLNI